MTNFGIGSLIMKGTLLNLNNVLAISLGIVLASILVSSSILLIPFQDPRDPPIIHETIGDKIAQKIIERSGEVEYFWSANNTWINNNVSTHFNEYIDAFQIAFIDQTFQAGIFRFPQEPLNVSININIFDAIITNMLSVIKKFDNEALIAYTIGDIFQKLINIWVFGVVHGIILVKILLLHQDQR
jgi:hypothetical protein